MMPTLVVRVPEMTLIMVVRRLEMIARIAETAVVIVAMTMVTRMMQNGMVTMTVLLKVMMTMLMLVLLAWSMLVLRQRSVRMQSMYLQHVSALTLRVTL